jgi:xylan 1,4-beta-xylosidase
MTNHALPRHPIQKERVRIELADAAEPRAAWLERIDEEHANAKRAWVEMGQPEYPSAKEVERLHEASRLVREPCAWQYDQGTIRLDIDIPPHAVAAVTVELRGA